MAPKSEIPATCYYCNKYFTKYKNFARHHKSKHGTLVIRTKDSQLISDLLPTETETIDENELNSDSEHSNVSSDEIVSNSEFSSNNGESLKRKISETSDDTKKTK